eukprot:301157-Prymnesium_polylepis.1
MIAGMKVAELLERARFMVPRGHPSFALRVSDPHSGGSEVGEWVGTFPHFGHVSIHEGVVGGATEMRITLVKAVQFGGFIGCPHESRGYIMRTSENSSDTCWAAGPEP